MSMNKFMHPRNKYRRPPDFKALAIKYPEFRTFAKQDISGKVSLNFKDLEAVRALTRTLLLEDFSLDVEIPPSRLVPTLPLRLNYLLWIEDLLQNNKRISDVIGIDIGCGASCVYPLLAAKQFGWRMLATEVDMESAFVAGRNIKKNNLQDMIKVRSVNEKQMLEGVLDPDTTYDFCMCNPPFFGSEEELDHKNISRSLSRPEPRNAHSGTTTELVAPGGETAFVSRIIQDSTKLKAAIRIYSVMLGHKSSVGKVKQLLEQAGVASSGAVTTEFCQGHTTRWGVAWTLDPSIELTQIDMAKSKKKKKPSVFCHTFKADFTSTVERLKKLLEELHMTHKFLKSTQDLYAMEITAVENTWSNVRKKKRQGKFNQNEVNDIGNKNFSNGQKVEDNVEKSINTSEDKNNFSVSKSEPESTNETVTKIKEEVEESQTYTAEAEDHTQVKVMIGAKRSLVDSAEVSSSSDCTPSKKARIDHLPSVSGQSSSSRRDPIFDGSLVVRSQGEGSSVEVTWLKGTGGRDAAHQVLQYFKNHFECSEVIP